MLLQIHKKKFNTQTFIILTISFLLWLPSLVFNIEPVIEDDNPVFFLFITNHLNNQLLLLLSITLIAVHSVILRFTTVANDLQRYTDLTTVFIYVVLMGAMTPYLNFHKGLIINLIVLLLIDRLFYLYEHSQDLETWFSVSVLVGIATIIHPGNLLLLLLIWTTLIIYRIYKIRTWLITILGVLSMILLFVFYLYWINQLQAEFHLQTEYLSNYKLGFRNFIELSTLPFYGFLILITIIILLRAVHHIDDYNNATRKRLRIIIFHMIFVWINILLFSESRILFVYQLYIPIAFSFARFLTKSNKEKLKSFLLVLLFLTIAFERYYYLSQ